MQQYDKYSAEELSEMIRKSSGSEKNYLVRLLLQKEKSDAVIARLLTGSDRETTISILRLLSPKDALRFDEILKQLQQRGDAEIKRIITNRLVQTNIRHESQQDITDTASVYKTWTRDPSSYPDVAQLIFYKNGQGIYQESKAGEIELQVEFNFFREGNTLRFGSNDTTGYAISRSILHHPYHGNQPCEVIQFTNKQIFIKGIQITGTEYYYLYKNK